LKQTIFVYTIQHREAKILFLHRGGEIAICEMKCFSFFISGNIQLHIKTETGA